MVITSYEQVNGNKQYRTNLSIIRIEVRASAPRIRVMEETHRYDPAHIGYIVTSESLACQC